MKISILLFLITPILLSQIKAQTSLENKFSANKERAEQSDTGTSSLLKELGNNACKCIEEISITNKSSKEIAQSVNKCIDEQTGAYQLGIKLMAVSQKVPKKNDTISLNTNQNSNDYKKYYNEMEGWLFEHCVELKRIVGADNKQGANSISNNKDAISAYNEGQTYLKTDDYKNALPFFEKAVNIDPTFAFAWDNLGICNRKLGNLDKALEAYKKSLALDPKGKTPLQNIPIVYMYQKEYDKAIDAYKQLLAVSPDDPEVYYGIGNIYFSAKNDMEKGLENMCKAYNIYSNMKSPYRVDAQKIISMIYTKMKADGKEDSFNKILKDNNINTTK